MMSWGGRKVMQGIANPLYAGSTPVPMSNSCKLLILQAKKLVKNAKKC